MIYLVIATVCFSISFGLINNQLTGIPSDILAFLRLLLAGIVFLPFFKPVKIKKHLKVALIGIIQFGLMYMFFIQAFQYLQGNEVVILTTSTPALVAICSVMLGQKFKWYYFGFILMSIIGAVIIIWDNVSFNFLLKGVLLMEASNFCFALGQVLWKKYVGEQNINVMSSAYLGAALFVFPIALVHRAYPVFTLSISQWLSILYLGLIPTGLGFYLWNKGVKKVNSTILAIMNNLKIPMGVLIAVVIFKESINVHNFLIGSIFILLSIVLTNIFIKRDSIK